MRTEVHTARFQTHKTVRLEGSATQYHTTSQPNQSQQLGLICLSNKSRDMWPTMPCCLKQVQHRIYVQLHRADGIRGPLAVASVKNHHRIRKLINSGWCTSTPDNIGSPSYILLTGKQSLSHMHCHPCVRLANEWRYARRDTPCFRTMLEVWEGMTIFFPACLVILSLIPLLSNFPVAPTNKLFRTWNRRACCMVPQGIVLLRACTFVQSRCPVSSSLVAPYIWQRRIFISASSL